jgi:hypothetical protein
MDKEGMSFERIHELVVGEAATPITEDEIQEVSTRARRGGKHSLLIAAMAATLMPFQQTQGRLPMGFRRSDEEENYLDLEDMRRAERERELEAQGVVALSKAEEKRKRRMERNLKNVQRPS